MSDRIDELVSNIEDGLHGKCGFTLSESSLNNLATIARKHEANRMEALRQCLRADKAEADRDKWIDRCYQSDERALKAEAMCEWLAERLEESDDTVLMADTWLAVASEAV